MNRRHFLGLVGAAIGSGPSGASAGRFEESVIAQLKSQGYLSIVAEHTLLGRVRIMGQLASERREIILNPRTGEILRDQRFRDVGDNSGPQIKNRSDNIDDGDDDDNPDHSGGGETGGNHGSGGETGDDDDDDDDDDDN